MGGDYVDVPAAIVDRVRALCMRLPDAYEEKAWAGARWMVRKRTFAHVLGVEDGNPRAYALAAGAEGPLVVVTFPPPGVEGPGYVIRTTPERVTGVGPWVGPDR